jgi:hypothetical protein
MRRDARLWVPLAGISAGGILVGHCLGYLAAFGPRHAHHAGGTVPHRYLPTAAAAAAALALAAGVLASIDGWRSGRVRAAPPGGSLLRITRAWPRLAAAQVAGFVVLEVGERVAVGGTPSIAGRVLAFGIAAQLIVALAATVLLELVWGTAERLGRAFSRFPANQDRAPSRAFPDTAQTERDPYRDPHRARGPPVPAPS